MANFREYEVLIPISNIDQMSRALKNQGGKIVKQVTQVDVYYDFLPLKLSKKDELLRLRSEYKQGTHEFLRGEFSWKSGRRGTIEKYEVRDDISVPLKKESNIKKIHNILSKLGINQLVNLEKTRDRWILNDLKHVMEFEFDKKIVASGLKRPKKIIGAFLQATIETSEEISDLKVRKILWDVLYKLGFTIEDYDSRSYIEIYLDVKKH